MASVNASSPSAARTSGRNSTGGSAANQRRTAICEAVVTAPASTTGGMSRSASRPVRSAIASARARCIAAFVFRYSPRMAGGRVTGQEGGEDEPQGRRPGPPRETEMTTTTVRWGRASSDEADLYYERRGDGPPLLLITGGGGDAGYYSALAGILADEYTV